MKIFRYAILAVLSATLMTLNGCGNGTTGSSRSGSSGQVSNETKEMLKELRRLSSQLSGGSTLEAFDKQFTGVKFAYDEFLRTGDVTAFPELARSSADIMEHVATIKDVWHLPTLSQYTAEMDRTIHAKSAIGQACLKFSPDIPFPASGDLKDNFTKGVALKRLVPALIKKIEKVNAFEKTPK